VPGAPVAFPRIVKGIPALTPSCGTDASIRICCGRTRRLREILRSVPGQEVVGVPGSGRRVRKGEGPVLGRGRPATARGLPSLSRRRTWTVMEPARQGAPRSSTSGSAPRTACSPEASPGHYRSRHGGVVPRDGELEFTDHHVVEDHERPFAGLRRLHLDAGRALRGRGHGQRSQAGYLRTRSLVFEVLLDGQGLRAAVGDGSTESDRQQRASIRELWPGVARHDGRSQASWFGRRGDDNAARRLPAAASRSPLVPPRSTVFSRSGNQRVRRRRRRR
jgi:hypothetical protein